MKPTLIGFFPRRPRPRPGDPYAQALPPQIEEFCTVGHLSESGPPGWVDLWLHNAFWFYSTERQAWAAAVDTANLLQIFTEESRRWDGVRGSVQRLMDRYIARHVPAPETSFSTTDERFHWQLYAYRMFPLRFAGGVETPLEIPEDDFHPAEPLPADYVSLGLDLVNRHHESMFECSPLNCNGAYTEVAVNRYCLLDDLATALPLARHWSDGKYRADGAYVGPAEPGPYFIIEVLRKRLGTATHA